MDHAGALARLTSLDPPHAEAGELGESAPAPGLARGLYPVPAWVVLAFSATLILGTLAVLLRRLWLARRRFRELGR